MDRPTPDDLVTLNRASTIARLLSGLVHEVNNALLVISGSAELLEEPGASPEVVARRASRIRGQAMRAAAAIATVLEFARGEPAGRGRVNLREIAATAVALRAYAIGRAGLTMALAPGDERPIPLTGNRTLLLQALLNLIVNAEAALAGRPGGAIRVELGEEADAVTVWVADTGPGVAASDRTRIFQPFVASGAAPHASGLGLPAAARIAEWHGGTLTLEDTAIGAVFRLRLPVGQPADPGVTR